MSAQENLKKLGLTLPSIPTPVANYVPWKRDGNTIYLSGQLGIVPGSMKLVPGGIKEEARQTLENIRTALEAHGYKMSDLVKCTVMLADMSEWAAFNDVYKTFFTGHFPARSAFGANGLALGARVEVECIAAVAK